MSDRCKRKASKTKETHPDDTKERKVQQDLQDLMKAKKNCIILVPKLSK